MHFFSDMVMLIKIKSNDPLGDPGELLTDRGEPVIFMASCIKKGTPIGMPARTVKR